MFSRLAGLVKRTIYQNISIEVGVSQMLRLSFRWKWVVPKGVPFANSSILAMNVQFGFLFSREFSCGLNGFTLSVETPRYAISPGFTYGPLPIAGNHMLCFATHLIPLRP